MKADYDAVCSEDDVHEILAAIHGSEDEVHAIVYDVALSDDHALLSEHDVVLGFDSSRWRVRRGSVAFVDVLLGQYDVAIPEYGVVRGDMEVRFVEDDVVSSEDDVVTRRSRRRRTSSVSRTSASAVLHDSERKSAPLVFLRIYSTDFNPISHCGFRVPCQSEPL